MHRVSVDERFLDRMQFAVLFQSLDGLDFLLPNRTNGPAARPYRHAIQQYRTRAAFAFAAAVLGAGQLQVIAQDAQQRPLGIGIGREGLAIDETFAMFSRPRVYRT